MRARILSIVAAILLLVGISAAPASAHDLPGRYCGYGSQAVYAGGVSWMQKYVRTVNIGGYHYHQVTHDPAKVGWASHNVLELCGTTGNRAIHY